MEKVVDLQWTDVDVLHQIWGLAKDGVLSPHILGKVIGKAFGGHEPEIRELVHRVLEQPEENRATWDILTKFGPVPSWFTTLKSTAPSKEKN